MRRIWGQPRRWPRLSRLAIAAAIAAALAWGTGFVWFTESIPRTVKKPHEVTDAIVVLTGGVGRLVAGLELQPKCIVQLHLALSRDALVAEQRKHAVNFLLFEAKCLQVSQGPVSLGMQRVYFDTFSECGDRGLLITQSTTGVTFSA